MCFKNTPNMFKNTPKHVQKHTGSSIMSPPIHIPTNNINHAAPPMRRRLRNRTLCWASRTGFHFNTGEHRSGSACAQRSSSITAAKKLPRCSSMSPHAWMRNTELGLRVRPRCNTSRHLAKRSSRSSWAMRFSSCAQDTQALWWSGCSSVRAVLSWGRVCEWTNQDHLKA